MAKVKLCCIPTNGRTFSVLTALQAILPDVNLLAPVFDDGTGGGDPEGLLRDLISECAAVAVFVSDEPVVPQARTTGWGIARQLGKPVVVVLVKGGCKDVPPDLAPLPLIDVGPLLQTMANLGESAVLDPESTQGAFRTFRDSLNQAIDSALPAAPRKEIEELLAEADRLSLEPSREKLLAALDAAGKAYGRARELGSLGLHARAREKAGELHSSLNVELLRGDEENLSGLEASVLDRWEEGCRQADLIGEAISLRLARLIRCGAAFTAEESLGQLQDRWKLVCDPDNAGLYARLSPFFEQALLSLTERFIQRANEGDLEVAGAGLVAAARILDELLSDGAREYALACAAQAHAGSLDGSFKAVRCLEQALRVRGEEFKTDLRAFTFKAAEVVRERLESRVQDLMDRGQAGSAWAILQLLTRLSRALPDQEKLAEDLACLAQLSTELPDRRSSAASTARDARHLARVYRLDQLTEMLDGMPAE
jgi:hypothetical protein